MKGSSAANVALDFSDPTAPKIRLMPGPEIRSRHHACGMLLSEQGGEVLAAIEYLEERSVQLVSRQAFLGDKDAMRLARSSIE